MVPARRGAPVRRARADGALRLPPARRPVLPGLEPVRRAHLRVPGPGAAGTAGDAPDARGGEPGGDAPAPEGLALRLERGPAVPALDGPRRLPEPRLRRAQ